MTLDEAAQGELVRLARVTLERYVRHGDRPACPRGSPFDHRGGVFVTLNRHGRLRGCIGSLLTERELGHGIVDCTIAAASRDPRFPPVTADELAAVDIELSVLSELQPIAPSAIEVGRHGLVIRGRGRSGVLLPQVPVELGWDRATFLQELCAKAGLEAGAWRSGEVDIAAFTAAVFGERSGRSSVE